MVRNNSGEIRQRKVCKKVTTFTKCHNHLNMNESAAKKTKKMILLLQHIITINNAAHIFPVIVKTFNLSALKVGKFTCRIIAVVANSNQTIPSHE